MSVVEYAQATATKCGSKCHNSDLFLANPAFFLGEYVLVESVEIHCYNFTNTCELGHRLLKFKQMPVRIPYDLNPLATIMKNNAC